MNLQEIFDFVNLKTNKNQSGNTLNPDRFNTALNAVNIDFFKLKYGLPEEYVPGRSLPRQSWETTVKITDDLSIHKVLMGGLLSMPLQVDSNGYAEKPNDYVHVSSMGYKKPVTVSGKTLEEIKVIDLLTDDQWNPRLSNSITKPNHDYPVARIIGNKIQFEPKDIKNVEFAYLRMASTPFYDYKIVNDAIVYLPAGELHDGSVLPAGTPSRTIELDWPIDNHTDIANLILGYVSANLRETFLYQDSQNRKQTGI
jgi:hypothetical protein